MAYIIQDRIEVSIFINGNEYPLDPGSNTLNFLHVGMQTKGKLPTCHFSITDNIRSVDYNQLQDGIPIRIALKMYQYPTQIFNFRLFHKTKQFNGAAWVYSIDGYLAYPLYWLRTSNKGYQGTSSQVLQQIASICGLQYNGVSTNDSQLWLQRNRSYSEFVKSITRGGYIDDTSYLASGVDFEGVLHYVNVNDLPAPIVTLVGYQVVANYYTVVDFQAVGKSGLGNSLTGYANTRYTQSSVSDELFGVHNDLAFTPDTRAPLFNTAIQKQLERGYQSYGPIDVGNVHTNYERAVYQNMRYANLNSLDVEFLLNTPVPLTLFEKFTFSVEVENQAQDAASSGDYIFAAGAYYIEGANFALKIIGTRTGDNDAYTNG